MAKPPPKPARNYYQKKRRAHVEAEKRKKGDARRGEHPLKERSRAAKIKTTRKSRGEGRIKLADPPKRGRKVRV
jgi:hypothetical protein